MGEDKPYQDERWLREQYWVEGRSLEDIAEQFGMTHSGIRHWFQKHDIETRSQQQAQKPDAEYADPEWLAERYHGEGLSIADIADRAGASPSTIHRWMKRYDIERRTFDYERRTGAVAYQSVYGEFGDIPGGYMQLRVSQTIDGERELTGVYVHQLIAIAEGADPDKVFSGGEYHVHHEDGIRWNNHSGNIELVTAEEHREIHTGDE